MFRQADASSKSYVKISKPFEQDLLISTASNCFPETIHQNCRKCFQRFNEKEPFGFVD